MPLRPQQVIVDGKYQLLEVIGQGGFARVWKAQEFDHQGNPLRLVAIKELRREALSAEALREQELRFQREIRVSALLTEAPNVVHGFTTEQAALEDGSRIPLLILEYMAGGSLAELLKQHPKGLPVDQAVRYALDLCAALEALHRLDIVHRDVKPSNILFRSQDRDGPACLSDFGIAQVPGDTVSGSRTRGTAGLQPGTPDYWPPEQARERGSLAPSADVYALGGVLFEMLTGRCYNRLVRQGSRYPRGTRPGQLRREVPAWLDRAVVWALQDDPARRCPSAAALREALERGLRSSAWRPIAMVVGGAMLVIGLALGTFRGWLPSVETPPPAAGSPPTAAIALAPATPQASPVGEEPAETAAPSATPTLTVTVASGRVVSEGEGARGASATPTSTATVMTSHVVGEGEEAVGVPVTFTPAATVAALVSTNTPAPTSTNVPTNTPTNVATNTATNVRTNTPTDTPTRTPTAVSTNTPAPTPTPTPTNTPTNVRTNTLTNTATNAPTRTATATPGLPTHTPTAAPQIVVDPAELTRFKLVIGQYRLAEKAALRTQAPNVMELLTAFADGEALADVQRRVAMIESQGMYQELIVERMDVQQVVVWKDERAGALVRERYTLRTYQPTAGGDRLVDETIFEGDIVYGLIHQDSRWKVATVREVQGI